MAIQNASDYNCIYILNGASGTCIPVAAMITGFDAAAGQISTAETYLYAKSGAPRTSISYEGQGATAGNASQVAALTSMWSRTARLHVITSLTFNSHLITANGFGAGTHIELWAGKRTLGGNEPVGQLPVRELRRTSAAT